MKFSNIVAQTIDSFTNLNNFTQLFFKNKYLLLILAHFLLGILIYWEPLSCRLYIALVFFFGCTYIVKNPDDNQYALFAAAYVTGGEVLLRMVDGASHEFAKCAVFVFSLLGIFYNGFSRKSWPYVLLFLLLFPSLLLSNDFQSMTRNETNVVIMSLSGPICLAFLSIYTFGKKVSFVQISRILLLAALPVITISTYVFMKSPDTTIIRGVTSNMRFSGMFGPNQVATVLGMGMFVFFTRAMLNSESRFLFVLNLMLGSFMAYIGLLTFSRGGMITGFCTIIITAVAVFLKSKDYGKLKAKVGLTAFLICFLAVFSLVSYQTNGLIVKRYTNRDKQGRIKLDRPNDRRAIATKEVKLFIQNPVLGVSVTEAEKVRMSNNREVHSHNEITRMLAEHGTFGFLGVLILILTPVWLLFYKRQNVLLAAFFVFWFLTVNHSGMRIVAPAFFYALMFLRVDLSQVTFFHRLKLKQTDL